MKSVVLVNPPLQLVDRYGKDMKHFGGVSEPLGLGYIAGYLEQEGVPVRIIDSQAEHMGIDELVKNIIDHGDDIVGITFLTPMFSSVKALSERVKASDPSRLVVLGGAHCISLPERTLEEIPCADVICHGEGEFTMEEIARKDISQWGEIEGLCFRRDGEIVKTPQRKTEKDLDVIPFPARHLLPMDKYRLTASRVSGSGYCPTIVVARGCPFHCTFCSLSRGLKLRTHSVERIIAEVQHLIDTYGAEQVNIEADTLTINRRFLVALCEAFIESGISKKVQWTCESRIDSVDEELLTLMKEAGCWQVSYGIEAGSQRLLALIKKKTTLKQIEDVCALTKRMGITIRGFFMLGLPTETREESFETINFAKKIDPTWAQFTVTVPYPGTPMYDELAASGEIRTYDWDKYNTWWGWKDEEDAPFVPKGRTVKELQVLQKRALREFYLRPTVFWRFLMRTRSLYDFSKYAKGVWVLWKTWFSEASLQYPGAVPWRK
jgi:radical SAM superfamily enzyme YgiQ (UPF0313 family)